MTTPSVRLVMEQARVIEKVAVSALRPVDSTVTSAVWRLKLDKYVRDIHGYGKPHLYLAQYPSGKSYWHVCGSLNRSLNMEAYRACNELNSKHQHDQLRPD